MYRKRAILFTVSVLLLSALFLSIDWGEFVRVTSRISFRMICALLIIQAFIIFFTALKWYVFVRRYAVSFTNVLYTSLIGLMVNSLTPASIVGGEPVKAYVLSRIDRIRMETAFATVFVDLFVTVVPVLILNLVAILLVLQYSFDLRIAWLLAIVGAFILALTAMSFSVLMNRRPSMRLFKWFVRVFGRVGFVRRRIILLESRVDDLFISFHRSIRDTMTDTWTLSVGVVVSSMVWVLSLFRVYLIFLSLDVPIQLNTLLIVYTVTVAVSILPLLPGSLGLWEWVGSGLFMLFGVPPAVAVAVVLIDRVLFYWLPVIAGAVSALHVGLNVMGLVDKS